MNIEYKEDKHIERAARSLVMLYLANKQERGARTMIKKAEAVLGISRDKLEPLLHEEFAPSDRRILLGN